MQKSVRVIIVLLSVVSCLLLVNYGCGQQGETPSTTTTTVPAANISLSGTLTSGNISSAGIRTFSSALSDYKVVAIDNATGKTYPADTDTSGNFSITLPAKTSYEVSIIDSSSQYVGPIVMVGGAGSSEVCMGIKPTDDINLGSIIADLTNKFAQPTSEPTSIANLLDLAKAVAGKPKGAGNNGKEEFSGITTREAGADFDKDGIPNLFDADEDNDGIRNGILAHPSSSTVSSNTVEAVYMNSNIWAEHGTAEEAKDVALITITVRAKTGKLSEILSAEVIDVPSSIKDVAVLRDSTSFGDPENYPAEWTAWENENHKLYKLESDNTWKALFNPKGDMNVGDTFTIRVTYTGGSYQDFFITNSYFMTDWPRIITCEGTALPTSEGTKSSPKNLSASGTTLAISFTKPKDEDGNILEGLTYSVGYGTCEASGGSYGVGTNTTSETVSDVSGASVLSHTLSNITTNAANQAYYVVPVAEANGQRNGAETWFTKP